MMGRNLAQIRTDSRAALAGNYSVCFTALFFLFLANVAISQILYLIPLPNAGGVFVIFTDILYSLPGAVILTMLQAGLMFLCLNIARYGRPAFSDILLAFRYDTARAAGLSLVLGLLDVICSLPVSYAMTDLLLAFSSAFYGGGSFPAVFRNLLYLAVSAVLSLALRVVFAYPFSQALMLYIDHQEYSVAECLMNSRKLMRGQIFRYLKLELSFLGYLALSVISFGIGLIWVVPYLNVSRANFYMDLTGTYNPY